MKFIKTILPYLVIALISYIYLSQYSHFLFGNGIGDGTGTIAGAWRIAQGQVIYRDFFAIFSPGNFFLLAFIYKLFGYHYIVTNEALIVIDIIISLLLYRLSYIVIKQWYAIIPPLIFLLIGFPSWFIFYHYWTTSVPLLITLILLYHYLIKQKNEDKSAYIYLFLIGIFTGLTGLFLQSSGIYTIAVLLAVICFRIKKREGIIKRLAVFSAGIIVPVSIFAIYLLLNRAVDAFVHDQIILLKFYPPIALFLFKPLMSILNIFTPMKLLIIGSFVFSIIFLFLALLGLLWIKV